MTNKTKKVIALTSAFVMTASLLTSCGTSFKYEGSVDERVVMKVGGFDVTADEYSYFYKNAKFDLDQGLESYWEEHPGALDELKGTVEEMLKIRFAVNSLAKECDIKLNKDELASINDEAEAAAAYYGGDEQFMAVLAGSNMTGDVYYDLTAQALLDEKLRGFYIAEFSGFVKADDATLEKDIVENFIRAKQVLISNDVNDDILANKALAEDIAARAAKGENFDKLIEQYSEDGSQDTADGRYFTYGMMLEPFEEAAYALDEGEVSGVVESVVGYHVIQRLPLEEAYINEYFEDFRDLYKNRCYNEKLDEVAASLTVEYTDEFEEVFGANG